MKTHKTPRATCPECKYFTNRASNSESLNKPKPDDFSICLNCGAWLRFNNDMTFRITESVDELLPEQVKYMKKATELILARGRFK